MSVTEIVRGTLARVKLELRNLSGVLADAEGALTLIVIDPEGGEKPYSGGEITHDGTGLYHRDYPTKLSGLHHYRWLVAGQVADEGTFPVTSEFDVETDEGGEEPDLTDLKVLLPRARRKIEGPFGLPNGKAPLTDSVIYNMVGDAVAEVVMLSGSFFHHQLLVKARDPLGGFPVAWKTNTALDEYETAIVCAQVALNFYQYLFRDMKVSETIQNEGTQWTWEVSANAIRTYYESLMKERDLAIEGLRVNIPVLDHYASNIRVRDQATVAVLEWWDINSPGLTGGGLPGGQEATTIPWFPGPES